jgi:hypothetical protein
MSPQIVAINGQECADKNEVLEIEPVACHDGWRCGCDECSAWRERNEPNFRRWTGLTFIEWLERRERQSNGHGAGA